MQQHELVSAVTGTTGMSSADADRALRATVQVLGQARQHARATMAAVKAGLTGHEFDHVATQLPPDYADLLGTEPVQHH
jgi:uncharacterized protein (DUF2267 family)